MVGGETQVEGSRTPAQNRRLLEERSFRLWELVVRIVRACRYSVELIQCRLRCQIRMRLPTPAPDFAKIGDSGEDHIGMAC